MSKKRKAEKRQGKQAIGYVRVSSGLSLKTQRDGIERYCRFRKLNLVEVVEEVDDRPYPLIQRASGRQLLQRLINNDEFAHVVGFKLDRLFHSTVDCFHNVNDWDQLGVSLHLVDFCRGVVIVRDVDGGRKLQKCEKTFEE